MVNIVKRKLINQMRKALIILSFLLICIEAKCQDRLLLSGTLSEEIVILNRKTNEIEWRYNDKNGQCKECNSLIHLKNNRIVYTYKKGATMIDSQGQTIWNFHVNEGEEMQSVSRSRGGMTLAIAGNPMRIVEIDINGNIKNETHYNTEIENIHKQFRQIAITKRGNYIIPITASRRVIELTPSGEVVKDIKLEETPFYVSTTKKGNWIVTCGHSGKIYEIDKKSSKKREITSGKRLNNGANIEFAAGIIELKNGNLLLANWVGHNGDRSQPILIELSKDGNVIWQMNEREDFTFTAGIDAIY